jgi:hypothetical protein
MCCGERARIADIGGVVAEATPALRYQMRFRGAGWNWVSASRIRVDAEPAAEHRYWLDVSG